MGTCEDRLPCSRLAAGGRQATAAAGRGAMDCKALGDDDFLLAGRPPVRGRRRQRQLATARVTAAAVGARVRATKRHRDAGDNEQQRRGAGRQGMGRRVDPQVRRCRGACDGGGGGGASGAAGRGGGEGCGGRMAPGGSRGQGGVRRHQWVGRGDDWWGGGGAQRCWAWRGRRRRVGRGEGDVGVRCTGPTVGGAGQVQRRRVRAMAASTCGERKQCVWRLKRSVQQLSVASRLPCAQI